MRKRIVLLPSLFIGLLILVSGCSKKDSAPQNNAPVSYKVKSVISANTSGGSTTRDTTNYTYDSLGRMTSYSGGIVTSSFIMTGNIISISISALPTSISGTLNANGLVKQIIQSPISSYPEFDASFSYDATGALVSDSTIWVNNGTTGLYDETHITWSDSNLIGATTTSYQIPGSPQTNTYTFTYTNTREYRDYGFGSYFGFAWHATGTVAGRNSRNLVNVETGIINGTIKTYAHSYTFDTHGRVATETVTGSDGSINVSTYTYY